ncbi:MAG: tRNA lysidine(34) synthetase TilS [Pseudomonadota bacterium]
MSFGTEPRREGFLLNQATMAQISGVEAVIVAVSGGGDSLALLDLVLTWSKDRPDAPRIIVATVDHALRNGSAGEADWVASLCMTAGIEHHVLLWVGPKPKTGRSQAARDARYDLLCGLAEAHQAGAILLGHTLDDQVETIVMRARRTNDNSVGDMPGLAGIAPVSHHNPSGFYAVKLVRPLLSTKRDELRNHLRSRGTPWLDDPTNDNLTYERPRIRLELGHTNMPPPQQIVVLGDCVARQRQLRAQTVASLIDTRVSTHGTGRIQIGQYSDLDRSALTGLLSCLVGVSGGGRHRPTATAVKPIVDMILAAQMSSLTLGRAKVGNQRCGVTIERELRHLPVISVEPGERKIWDGRLAVSNVEGCEPVFVTALGNLSCNGADVCDRSLLVGRLKHNKHRPDVLSQPVICQPDGSYQLPLSDQDGLLSCQKSPRIRLRRYCASIERYSPIWDAEIRFAVGRLWSQFSEKSAQN